MRYLVLLLALLVAGCDSPVEPARVLYDTDLEVAWTAGFKRGDGKFVWMASHQARGNVYLCQIHVSDAVSKGDDLRCDWRLREQPVEYMQWDETLVS